MQTKFLHFVFRKLNIRINRLVYIVKCFEDIVKKVTFGVFIRMTRMIVSLDVMSQTSICTSVDVLV